MDVVTTKMLPGKTKLRIQNAATSRLATALLLGNRSTLSSISRKDLTLVLHDVHRQTIRSRQQLYFIYARDAR
jgi:hypothetical protein